MPPRFPSDSASCGSPPGWGEADLIVDDDVDRAARSVALDIGQPEGFSDDALSAESRVAMHQQAQHLAPFLVAALTLFGADLADHHGIDRFEMRRVGGQRQVNLLAVELSVGGRA